jgi:hypothetical protein
MGLASFAVAVWTAAAVVLGVVVFTAAAGLVNVMAIDWVAALAAIAVGTALARRRVHHRSEHRRVDSQSTSALAVDALLCIRLLVRRNLGRPDAEHLR